MSAVPIDAFSPPYNSGTLTLSSTPTVLVFDRRQARTPLVIVGKNLGVSNTIDKPKIEVSTNSDTDAQYEEQSAAESAIGTTAPGMFFDWAIFDDTRRFVRLTLASASGTTASVQVTGGG